VPGAGYAAQYPGRAGGPDLVVGVLVPDGTTQPVHTLVAATIKNRIPRIAS
jgi:hypothetical protein